MIADVLGLGGIEKYVPTIVSKSRAASVHAEATTVLIRRLATSARMAAEIWALARGSVRDKPRIFATIFMVRRELRAPGWPGM